MFFITVLFTAGCTSTNSRYTASNNAEINTENQIQEEFSEEIVKQDVVRKVPDYLECFTSANIYDYVDPDTGVHYLVFRDTSYQSGRGGITPRLNSDGTLMVDDLSK